jgi:histidinol-phosphate aminotransferase
MTHVYERHVDTGPGLRLHLNENTGGCSPRVLEALRQLVATDVSHYPDYGTVVSRAAQWFGVDQECMILTNGMDEGILAACVAAFQQNAKPRGEALIPVPAFDEYAASTSACGGIVVTVAPRADFDFPLEELLDKISDRTRIVFLTSPGNPTGLLVPRRAIEAISQRLSAGALLFVDEAYVDFSRETFFPHLTSFPNVIIGRTFSKAFGLAALRVGALLGDPRTLEPMRRVVPPYSLNVFACAGLLAALDDEAYVRWYRSQVTESRELAYAACKRRGWRYWPSEANFVLIRVGPHASQLVADLATHRIFVRDRTRQPGCAGCVRITTGLVEHTKACLDAIEEILSTKGASVAASGDEARNA